MLTALKHDRIQVLCSDSMYSADGSYEGAGEQLGRPGIPDSEPWVPGLGQFVVFIVEITQLVTIGSIDDACIYRGPG